MRARYFNHNPLQFSCLSIHIVQYTVYRPTLLRKRYLVSGEVYEVAWWLVMEDEFGHESDVETSHPDIDRAIEIHLGSDDFCYKTIEVDGSTTHLIKKRKKRPWKDQITFEDKDVKGFDNEEMVTFLILKISMDRVSKRTMGVMLVLYFIIGVPVTWYISIALGYIDPYSFAGLLLGGAVMVPFVCICYIWSNSAERSVDDRLYSTRSNFITVLQKMKDLKEAEFQKKDLEERIRRLVDRYQTRPIE